MSIFKHLWQRIFAYSLILVIVSLGVGVVFHRMMIFDKSGDVALRISTEIWRSLEGQSTQSVETMLRVFNKHRNKLWLEDSTGATVAGEPFNSFSRHDWAEHLTEVRKTGSMTLWKTSLKEPRYLLTAPLTLDGKPLTFFNAFASPPSPPLDTLLFQGLFTTALIGGLLALWMARQVCRPLRLLRQELSEMYETAGPKLKKVTVKGNDEIAEVASAINRLVDSLNRHIGGIRLLVVNISHELRSPLARMTLSAEMIEEGLAQYALPRGKGDMSEDRLKKEAAILLAKKHILTLNEELEHMDRLIGATLLSSKLDLHEPGTLNERVCLSLLCHRAASRFESMFQHAELVFLSEIEPDLHVLGDETLLMQMLSNILDNGLKYTRGDNAHVWLRLKKRKGGAFLSVENSYDAMPSEVLERIFEPFYRHKQTTGTGVGLGLSLVQKIATLHKGDAMAVATDIGICICIQLPLTECNTAPLEIPPVIQ